MDKGIGTLKQHTARLSVISNTLLLILKLLVGVYTGTISIIAEAAHSAIDLMGSLIAYYAVQKSATPPDDNHHYGHGKFENLSGVFEALLIILAALWILYEAIESFSRINPPAFLEYGIAVMLVSIVVNYGVANKLLKIARQTCSPALEADAMHLQTDIWTSAGVLIGLSLIQVTDWPWVDPIIAIMIAVVVFKAGYSIIKKNLHELTDISLSKEDEHLISQIVTCHDHVLSLYRLRTRRSGSYCLIDMHLTLDSNMPLDKAHAVCDQLEDKIKTRLGLCDIVIHLEPHEEKKVSFVPETKQI